MPASRSVPTPWLPLACSLMAWPVLAAPAAAAPTAPAPITLEADRLQSIADEETVAEGDVRLRQGDLRIRADRLAYRPASDRASATGDVEIRRSGAVYRGRELELTVRDFSGWFIAPEFDFPLLGTRGEASRIDFASRTRLAAEQARYTSCPRTDGDAEPDWQLRASRVTLDFDANEGRAENARLRFQGVTILALPRLSFPVTGERKSGWLPPTVNLDSRSGFELSRPWYWNIAPDRDATLTPRLITKRGAGVDGEFRYLEPGWRGRVQAQWLPHDRLAGRSRQSLLVDHRQTLPGATTLTVQGARVSDDDWWKDFSAVDDGLAPRLLPASLQLRTPLAWGPLELHAYARVQHWQVLQDPTAPIVAPYARKPQLGLAGSGPAGPLELSFETEVNRFERPDDDTANDRVDGWRWHAVAQVGWPLRRGGLSVVPRLALNAATYRTDDPMPDGRRDASRLVPTLSVDARLAFERETRMWFGRPLRQTLEPRLLWVRTPYRRQDTLPNFDAFGKDFNLSSIYSTNTFSGIDRVSDAHELTAGATSRLVDPGTGAELLRVGAVQRFRFRDQEVAPQSDGSVDGEALTRRFSDVLLLAQTDRLLPGWSFDATLQYSPDQRRFSRSVVGASWSPGPYRTLSTRYRLARGVSEQMEVGWQWPLWQAAPARRPAASSGAGCSGTWYGVGRINYSLRDRRVTDSLIGAEYDAGCWVLRVVSERQSTGSSDATTRLLLQLELVGLSRLGSNPLRVLKDNIPGYRLLRDDTDDRDFSDSP
jgi:LPS-assembly protein